MREEEEAIERARALFERGAETVYVTVDDRRIIVDGEPPNLPGTMVAARSLSEVRRFVGDLKLDRRR